MSKSWRMTFVSLLVAVMVSIFVAACGSSGSTGSSGGSTPTTAASTLGTPGSYNCVQGSVTAAGSTALAPLVQAVAADYQKKCSGANITVNLGGSKTGLSNVEAGSVQIGNSDIPALSTQTDLVDHQVAIVVFVIITNPKVTGVTNLTTAQLKSIYSGSITNWSQVGGPNLKIVVVSRPASSGTRATFQKYILGGPESISGPSSLVSDSTGTVATEVSQTDGAIGYVTLGAAKKLNLDPVSIDSNAPTPTNVEGNTYKFWNIEHMFTKGPASGLAQALIDYMTNDAAKQIATAQSFISPTDMQSSALQAHQ